MAWFAEQGSEMPDGYVIGRALPEQIAQLPEVERLAASRFDNSMATRMVGSVLSVEALAEAQRSGRLWVAALPDGRPVGFALVEAAEDRVHLAELDVLPEHGRRGVGAGLLQAIEAWAAGAGYAAITLTTYRDVPWNAPFYCKLGFREIAHDLLDARLRSVLEHEEALGLEPPKRIAMIKHLTSA